MLDMLELGRIGNSLRTAVPQLAGQPGEPLHAPLTLPDPPGSGRRVQQQQQLYVILRPSIVSRVITTQIPLNPLKICDGESFDVQKGEIP